MNKGNLLIVDDEELIVDRVALVLEDVAGEIFKACNGLEAWEVLKSKQIHCVICDINMPKMNGVELIKKIRAQNNNVPFIFYTAHGNRDLMLEAVKYGAFDFLDKPNLVGLEDVVVRGLRESFKDPQKSAMAGDGTFISDYKKLLEEL